MLDYPPATYVQLRGFVLKKRKNAFHLGFAIMFWPIGTQRDSNKETLANSRVGYVLRIC